MADWGRVGERASTCTVEGTWLRMTFPISRWTFRKRNIVQVGASRITRLAPLRQGGMDGIVGSDQTVDL